MEQVFSHEIFFLELDCTTRICGRFIYQPVFYFRMFNLSWETEDEDDYHHYRRSRDDYRRMRRRRSRSGDREDEVCGGRAAYDIILKPSSYYTLNR